MLTEPDPARQAELLKATRDRTMATRVAALPDGERMGALAEEKAMEPTIRRVLHRSFDRKWLIADPRVIDFARRDLWRATMYAEQIFLVEQYAQAISSGPGVVVSGLIPDQDCFNNRGGRALSVFHPDGRATCGTKLLGVLAERLGVQVTGFDVLCYVAAVASHPGYT
ncbi:MAG: DNA methyltransferase, partial [Actinomycetota bacterium]|nr:DNA methyltransferase [Actinomycetota bacterium]